MDFGFIRSCLNNKSTDLDCSEVNSKVDYNHISNNSIAESLQDLLLQSYRNGYDLYLLITDITIWYS